MARWLPSWTNELCRHQSEMSSSKKIFCKGTLRQVFILPSYVFVWGGVAIWLVLNLVLYRVLNSCRIWSPTGLNIPNPTPSHTLSVYTVLYFDTGNGGGGWNGEKVRGATVHKLGRKYQHDWLYFQSINSDNHAPAAKSHNRSFF